MQEIALKGRRDTGRFFMPRASSLKEGHVGMIYPIEGPQNRQMTDNKRYWISARTRFNQERTLQKLLDEKGYESFIPMRRTIVKSSEQVREVEQPVIPNLIFLRATWDEAFGLMRRYSSRMVLVRGRDKKILTIPDEQMVAFIKLCNEMENKIAFRPDCYAPGDRVIIKSGPLAGIEGVLSVDTGKPEFVLRLGELGSVSVRIPKSNLIKIAEA